MQSEANHHGIPLPWNDIGQNLGKCFTETISGGAVIQHLAKLRKKYIDAGIPVPPPLRRGGGAGPTSILGQTATVNKNSVANASVLSGRVNKNKGPVAKKRRLSSQEASDESNEEDFASDSDGEYGQVSSKRTVRGVKKGLPRKEKIDDEYLDEGNTNDSFAESEKDGKDENEVEDRIVAAGASFLKFEDHVPIKNEEEKSSSKPSLILCMTKNGHAFVNKEPVKAQMENEEESDDMEASEDIEVSEDIEESNDEDDDTDHEISGEGHTGRESAVAYKDLYNNNNNASDPFYLPQDYSHGFDSAPSNMPTAGYDPQMQFGSDDIGSDILGLGGLPSLDTNDMNDNVGFNGNDSGGPWYNPFASNHGVNYDPGFGSDDYTLGIGNMPPPDPYQGTYGSDGHVGHDSQSQTLNSVGSTLPHLSSAYQQIDPTVEAVPDQYSAFQSNDTAFEPPNSFQSRQSSAMQSYGAAQINPVRPSNSRSTMNQTPVSENTDSNGGFWPARRSSVPETGGHAFDGAELDRALKHRFPHNVFPE